MLDKELKEMFDLLVVAHKTISQADSEISCLKSFSQKPGNESDNDYEARRKRDDEEHIKLWNQFKDKKKSDLFKCKNETVHELNEVRDKAIAALSSAESADLGQRTE